MGYPRGDGEKSLFRIKMEDAGHCCPRYISFVYTYQLTNGCGCILVYTVHLIFSLIDFLMKNHSLLCHSQSDQLLVVVSIICLMCSLPNFVVDV